MPTIQLRRKTKTEWTSANPVLADGEIGFEKDTNSFRIGDGTTLWGQLKSFVDSTVSGTGGGGGGTGQADTVDTLGLTGAVGRALMKAADAATARTAMGAGSSDLQIGTTSSTAKAGNYVPTWGEVSGKPAVIGAGTDAATARTAIGAGTSNLALGTTSTTAKAGNYVPAWADITSKPAVIAAGADAATARTAIGAGTSSLALGTTSSTAKAGDYRPAAADLTATGTRDATTFLRGDNVWVVPPAGGAGTNTLGYISVKSYGAIGDSSTDDTASIQSAYNACVSQGIDGNPKTLYFPAGRYRVTALPSFANYASVAGDSQRASTILYEGTGTLCTLSGRQEATFRNIGIWQTGIGSIGFDLSGCFSLHFESVLFRGQHGVGSTNYRTQVGVNIRDNTGNTQFHDCNWNNLGVGVRTRTIQNHISQSKFAYCYTSILGTGGDANAGMQLSLVEFDSAKDAVTTRCHIDIDGAANTWNISEVWFEGGNQAMIVGRAGVGGPSSLTLSQVKVAGRAVYLDFQHCTMITMVGLEFNPDQETPAGTNELSINATYCPIGTAIMLMTTVSGRNNQIPRSLFPSTWTVIDKAGGVIPGLPKQIETSQAAYNALATKDATALYVITS